jgi:hypothetical protein
MFNIKLRDTDIKKSDKSIGLISKRVFLCKQVVTNDQTIKYMKKIDENGVILNMNELFENDKVIKKK